MVQLHIPTYLLLSGNNSYLFLWFLFYYDKICVTISLSSLFIVCYVNIVHTCLYNCTTMIFPLEFDCLVRTIFLKCLSCRIRVSKFVAENVFNNVILNSTMNLTNSDKGLKRNYLFSSGFLLL